MSFWFRWTRKNISTSVCVHGTSCTASLSCYVFYRLDRVITCMLVFFFLRESHVVLFCDILFIYDAFFPSRLLCDPCISQLSILCTEKEIKESLELPLKVFFILRFLKKVSLMLQLVLYVNLGITMIYCQSVTLIYTVCL